MPNSEGSRSRLHEAALQLTDAAPVAAFSGKFGTQKKKVFFWHY